MFKEAVEDFKNQHGLGTILVDDFESDSVREHDGTFRWYFYKVINGKRIPAVVEFKSNFRHQDSFKLLDIKTDFPFPIKEIIETAQTFIDFMEPHFKEFFKKLDKDRLRKITNGQNYQGHNVNHHRDLKKMMEAFNKSEKPFTKEKLQKIYEQAARDMFRLNHAHDQKADADKYLVVHGKRGKQFGEKLEENMMAKVKEIHDDTYAIEFLFPFAKGSKSRHLSGAYLEFGTPQWIRKEGLVCFTVTEDELNLYAKEEEE